ncbi:MAG: S1C family serine protease [Halorhabdus sp.]
MSPDRLSRRTFLRGLGAVTVLGGAGCVASPDAEESTTLSGQPTATSAGDTTDDPSSVDRSRFATVYQAVRDSVVQVRVRTAGGTIGSGTGFVYDESHLITNEHVVADAQEVFVRYRSTGWRDASIVGTDIYSDLAVLAVDDRPEEAEPLPLWARDPPIGTEVIAIGNPYDLSGTVTSGIISGVDRTLSAPNNFLIPDAIQTDAPVNPGNSGGPLVDLDGRVVGVISAGGGDNIGLAISAPLTRRVVPALLRTGSYDHPYLGISLRNVTPAIASANDLTETTGVYVDRVLEGGPSDGVLRGSTDQTLVDGLSVPVGGDVIRELAGVAVPTTAQLSSVLALETSPGDTTAIQIFRGGHPETVEVVIGSRPS